MQEDESYMRQLLARKKAQVKALQEERAVCIKNHELAMQLIRQELKQSNQEIMQITAKLGDEDDGSDEEDESEASPASPSQDEGQKETATKAKRAPPGFENPIVSRLAGTGTGRMASDAIAEAGASSHDRLAAQGSDAVRAEPERMPADRPTPAKASPSKAARPSVQIYQPGAAARRRAHDMQGSSAATPSSSLTTRRPSMTPKPASYLDPLHPSEDAAGLRSRVEAESAPRRSVHERLGQDSGAGRAYQSPASGNGPNGASPQPGLNGNRAQPGFVQGNQSSGDPAVEIRRSINAQMDRMIPHDGSLIGQKRADSNGSTDLDGGDQAGAAVPVPQPQRKPREWDVHKSKDPQQDMDDRAPYAWGGPRELSVWADDNPDSPGNRLSGSLSGRGDYFAGRADPSGAEQHTRRFEDDFPGLRTGPSAENPSWRNEEERLQSFPSLGNAQVAVGTGTWGPNSASLRERLADGKPASRPADASQGPMQSIEEFERNAGLRHPDDNTSDAEHKAQVRSKKDYVFQEYTRNRGLVNSMEGLELHLPVLTKYEQLLMEAKITQWVQLGTQGRLRGRTFSAPRKWARGKGRITVQFGCCYNYAKDSKDRMPGIIPEEVVEAMPPVLVALAQRLVRWGIIPRTMEPDSAIVNIYEVDDCIPPHIDHHDFLRPFCTISLLSEEEIMFGSRLVPESAGVFHGVDDQHRLVKLPIGSCLILNGNGADVAMHCVPPVKERRMSITLRKMGRTHAAAVKAEAARAASGLHRTVGASEWRSNGTDSRSQRDEPGPLDEGRLSRQVDLKDLIVTKEGRGSADANTRASTRWESEAES